MFQKLKEAANGARLRAGQMWREHREKQEEQRASEPAGVTVPARLVRAAKFASWVATISLMYFLWLYTLDIARDRSADMHITRAGTWTGEIQFWFPYVFGFAIVAFGIPYVAKIAIPTFMSLNWRGNFWPKLWALIIALAVSLVVIAGTFAVQGDQLMERDREAAVAVEGVQQERAAIEAQIAGITDDLRSSTEGGSTQAQAARVGMLAGSVEAAREQWTNSYVLPAERARDPNTERIRRATGSAEAAAAAVARREALRQQLATTTTVAAVQGEVVTERTGWIADTLGWLEGVRAILLSLVMDVVALMMPWIALRLERARNRQLGMAEGIPRHPYMLSDERASPNYAAFKNPARRSAQDVVDAMIAGGAAPRFAADMARSAARSNVSEEIALDEDGTPLTEVRYYKRADGKPLIKNQKNRVIVPPGPPQPDETGVDHDGGGRVGSVAAVELVEPQAEEVRESRPQRDEQKPGDEPVSEASSIHPEPSDPPSLEDLPQDEVEALAAEIESAAEAIAAADEGAEREAEQVATDDNPDELDVAEAAISVEPVDQTEPSREPETNPNRLIAAE